MLGVILGIAAFVIGIFVFLRPSARPAPSSGQNRVFRLFAMFLSKAGGAALMVVGLFFLASSSFVFIDANSIGHLKRIYAFEELPKGRIIALAGQKGPQARILGPGFHFIPLIRVLYDVEEMPVISVPEGFYGQITSRDGAAMPEGMFIAPAIADDVLPKMLDAAYYINNGGYRGPQETVLKPGSYRLNRYLFDIKVQNRKATIIPAGHVGVVKSNVKRPGANCVEEKVSASGEGGEIEGALTVPLVPKGCVGIWKKPLFPGAYYLNRQAYQVTLVDTRVKTWVYKGGYTKRILELTIDDQGNIKQRERTEVQVTPKSAADKAVFVKMEGWDIPLELRALVQIQPENAPIVVGSVGAISDIEKRILTPAIRSIVRNVAGSQINVPIKNEDGTLKSPLEYRTRPTRVLDLIDNRDALERNIEELIKIEGRKAGVEIKEIRLGEPSLPPELLFARKREQLAQQLARAYDRETSAQIKRTEREKARSTADQQPRLVRAQIAVAVAKQREAERAALGRAERKFLEELALGQLAQAKVLGKDRVALLQGLEKILATLESKPELVKLVSRLVPHTVVGGTSNGLAGAAAIIGNAFRGREPNQTPDKKPE